MRNTLLLLVVASLLGMAWMNWGPGFSRAEETQGVEASLANVGPEGESNSKVDLARVSDLDQRVVDEFEQTSPLERLVGDDWILDGAPSKQPFLDLTVRMRVVDTSGQPVAIRPVHLQYFARAQEFGHAVVDAGDAQGQVTQKGLVLSTNDLGLLQLSIPEQQLVQGAQFGWVIELTDQTNHATARLDRVRIPPRALWKAGLDLGDVCLLTTRERYPVPLVSGTVLSDAGTPVPGLLTSFSSAYVAPDEEAGEWPAGIVGEVSVAEDGSFEAFGPPSPSGVNLYFMAPGYGDEGVTNLAVPRAGLHVVLAKRLRWSGRLMVPNHGPPVTEYGIWVTQEGGAIGVSPDASGQFSAAGSSRSLAIQVSYPATGVRLMEQELIVKPSADGSIADIDLRGLVWVFDSIVTDSSDQPRGEEVIEIAGEGLDLVLRNGVQTDDQGRLMLVIPDSVPTIELSREGGPTVTVRKDRITPRVDLD